LALLLLGAVAAAGLLTVLYSSGVKGAANDLVTNARKVLHTTTAHKHDGVFLEVVAFSGDVGRNLNTAAETDTSNLAKSRVGLFRGGCVDTSTHTTALWGALKCWCLALFNFGLSALTDQLLNGGHGNSGFDAK
jgi:hypothetical protein